MQCKEIVLSSQLSISTTNCKHSSWLFCVETCNEHSESDFDAFYSQKALVRMSVTVSPITLSALGHRMAASCSMDPYPLPTAAAY